MYIISAPLAKEKINEIFKKSLTSKDFDLSLNIFTILKCNSSDTQFIWK